MTNLKSLFDVEWYISTYPDIAKAGVEPLQHYLEFGRFEGRWPAALRSERLSHSIWFGEAARKELHAIAEKESDDALAQAEAEVARWELARFYAANNEWAQVIALLEQLEQADELTFLQALVPHQGPFLALFQAFIKTSQADRAKQLVAANHWPQFDELSRNDHCLAQAMVSEPVQRSAVLNQIYQRVGLAKLTSAQGQSLFDSLQASGSLTMPKPWQKRPKVSVIVPCFNCAATLSTAVNSLLAQSWRRLQIILVDDCSTDNTAEVMATLAQQDKRITLVHLAHNEGAYGARNAGLDASKGDFITTHDADDWSHPDKIASQVYDLLKSPQAMANRSAWVRADEQLNFSRWRPEASWIYPNVSSLMYRRAVFKRLGYWDTVTADGDTEFYYRLLAEYGANAIREVLPAVPLAFGRVAERSLTQNAATHISSMLGGTRRQYQEEAGSWHHNAKSLYLSRYPKKRPFLAPLSLCRGTPQAVLNNQQKRLQESSLFDADYYLQRYPDVKKANIEPAVHYLRFGAAEGRDPSDRFSTSGYRFVHGLPESENPLLHHLKQLEADNEGESPLELMTGEAHYDSRPLIMVVAHSTSGAAFGAEKSLLDVLAMLRESFRLWVLLPGALNPDYVQKIQACSDIQSFLPIRWWQPDRKPDAGVMHLLERWTGYVSLVYVNTLTQLEPLAAAQYTNVPSVVHVRELPEHDEALCDTLQASPEQVREHLLNSTDYVIANSTTVADWVADKERTVVIPNVIEPNYFATAKDCTPKLPLRIGMLSSNLAKKGVKDFYQLADSLYTNASFEWHLFGPLTEAQQQAQCSYPRANVVVHGYVDDVNVALKQLDVVLNLSHFKESFGRSVLEAMAAGKCVISYDWGALSELLAEDAGMLVPFKDTTAVAAALEELVAAPERQQKLCRAAQKRAGDYAVTRVGPRLVRHLLELCA
jgi:glycosyltransferase involved in cell wall biosynthesis